MNIRVYVLQYRQHRTGFKTEKSEREQMEQDLAYTAAEIAAELLLASKILVFTRNA